MPQRRRNTLVVVFILFVILFNYPIMRIVDRQELIAGVPILYFYLFFVWFLLIAAVAFIVLRHNK
jgi:hypothetical protein